MNHLSSLTELAKQVLPPINTPGSHPLSDIGQPTILDQRSSLTDSQVHLPPAPRGMVTEQGELTYNLRARLYDRPGNSDVVMAIRKQTKIGSSLDTEDTSVSRLQ